MLRGDGGKFFKTLFHPARHEQSILTATSIEG